LNQQIDAVASSGNVDLVVGEAAAVLPGTGDGQTQWIGSWLLTRFLGAVRSVTGWMYRRVSSAKQIKLTLLFIAGTAALSLGFVPLIAALSPWFKENLAEIFGKGAAGVGDAASTYATVAADVADVVPAQSVLDQGANYVAQAGQAASDVYSSVDVDQLLNY